MPKITETRRIIGFQAQNQGLGLFPEFPAAADDGSNLSGIDMFNLLDSEFPAVKASRIPLDDLGKYHPFQGFVKGVSPSRNAPIFFDLPFF